MHGQQNVKISALNCKCYYKPRGVRILQTSSSHLKILGARKVTRNKLPTQAPQISCAQDLSIRATESTRLQFLLNLHEKLTKRRRWRFRPRFKLDFVRHHTFSIFYLLPQFCFSTFIHSLAFSLRDRVGRNQSPVM